MRILNSVSSRFAKSYNYTMPEYRSAAPKGVKTGITVVAPAGPVRTVKSAKSPMLDRR